MYKFQNLITTAIFLLLVACTSLKPNSLNIDEVSHFKPIKKGSLISPLEDADQQWILSLVKECSWIKTKEDPKLPISTFKFSRKGNFITFLGFTNPQLYIENREKIWKCRLIDKDAKKLQYISDAF